ncbi:MAG: hydrogenase maturation protease [Gallionella sp.]|nr:hydrogenase maturation protease [Gallionella sp.]
MSALPAPVLIFAIGNESRQDDATGPLLLRELEAWLNSAEGRQEKADGLIEQVELLEDFQLQIEHAMDMKDRQRVLFIDAGINTPAPCSFYRITAGGDPVLYSHALAPDALLKVYEQFYQEKAPDSYVLCIRGESFELGEPLTAHARTHLAAALSLVRQLIKTPGDRSWDSLLTPKDDS